MCSTVLTERYFKVLYIIHKIIKMIIITTETFLKESPFNRNALNILMKPVRDGVGAGPWPPFQARFMGHFSTLKRAAWCEAG